MNKLNLRKNTKLQAIFLSALLVSACGEERTSRYIETERGLMGFGGGWCTLGMLTNNDRVNILDEEKMPITCDGYIDLTEAQKKEYKATH